MLRHPLRKRTGLPVIASTIDVPSHCSYGKYLLVSLLEAANGAREAHGAAAGTGVLGVESGVVREWVCELCRYRAEIFATGGIVQCGWKTQVMFWDCRGCDFGKLCGVFGYGG